MPIQPDLSLQQAPLHRPGLSDRPLQSHQPALSLQQAQSPRLFQLGLLVLWGHLPVPSALRGRLDLSGQSHQHRRVNL